MKSGGCSSAMMIYAAPAAVGSAAISAPMNGPLRSTATDATTTIVAVIAILRASPYQNSGSGSIRREQALAVGWAKAHSELALRHGSFSTAVELHLDRRAALDRLVDHAIALGQLEQLVELVLGRV